jgi:ferrous iron transport protein A
MLPLGLLSAGEHAEIVAIGEIASMKCDGRMEEMGLRIGKMVEMLRNGGGGPILLKVDESRLGIARGMAMKIMVRRTD